MEPEKLNTMMGLVAEAANQRKASGVVDKEGDRNLASADLFEAMVREAHEGVTFFAAGHHLMFSIEGETLPRQYVSADTLIFDHAVAKKIWGEDFAYILAMMAFEPDETRDAVLRQLFNARKARA